MSEDTQLRKTILISEENYNNFMEAIREAKGARHFAPAVRELVIEFTKKHNQK